MRDITAARFVILLGLASILAGCRLDTRPIVWLTDVQPPLVCPGESVTLSYDTAEPAPCLSGCPPEVEVDVAVAGSTITEGLFARGSAFTWSVGPVTSATTFTFTTTGGNFGSSRTPRSHSVDVILPEVETPVELSFAPSCAGDAVVWEPLDLTAPAFRSELVRLVRVCNFRSEILTLSLSFDSAPARNWTLVPGDCTETLPPELGRFVARAHFNPLFVSGPPVECTTTLSGLPPGVQLTGFLTCDVMTASSPIVAASPEPTTTTEIFEIPTLTPTSGQPPDALLIDLGQNTNCRRGPGTNYDVVTSFVQGQRLTLEGRNNDRSWWYALIPNSTAHCWIAGGNLPLPDPLPEVPVIAAPPTPTVVSPPAAPGKLVIAGQVCSEQTYTVTLGWTDVAGNDGYRVFRDGSLIATLGADATGHTDAPPSYGPFTYAVEAFNTGGASSRPTVIEPGCVY